jgi:dynein heavy chain
LELLFDIAMSSYRPLKDCLDDLVNLKSLWDCIVLVCETFASWDSISWDDIDTEELVFRVRDLSIQVKNLPKGVRSWKLHTWLTAEVQNMATVLPLINDLHSDTMRERHWTMLMTVTQKSFEKGPEFCFRNLLDLELHSFAEDVSEIVDQSAKEAKIEKKLTTIGSVWSKMPIEFDLTIPDCPLLSELGEILERLDSDSMEMMAMSSQGRFIEFCKESVDEWAAKLRTIDAVLLLWQKVQGNWCRLEPIFMQSEDIRSQLPDDSKRFEYLDNKWKDLMLEVSQSSLVVEICCDSDDREEILQSISDNIECCERSLNEYLEQKKKAFPRFYFVANQALLDVLSNGNNPLKVAEYLGDVFDGVKSIDFNKDPDKGRIGCGHFAKDGETVKWFNDVHLHGAVESYLGHLEQHIRVQLREILRSALKTTENWELDKPREFWLEDYPAQIALVTTQIVWTEETTRCFEEIEAGSENAMKEYKRINDDRIERLIKRVQTPLDSGLRAKIITVITIDVHSRDIVEALAVQKIFEVTDFKWVSQLRFYWSFCPQDRELVTYTPMDQQTCVIKICDWVTIYCYEYVGNCGRLVITPLTDRCYITLSQALNLNLGGAPAGPAGTGKTETTKDLSRAIGLFIVVFNCSDQMTYQTMAQILMVLRKLGRGDVLTNSTESLLRCSL